MKELVQRFLENLILKSPSSYGNLTVFPVSLSSSRAREEGGRGLDYVVLEEELLEGGRVWIREGKDRPKWWKSVLVKNRSRRPLLVLEGMLLEGGRQNRVVAQSYMLSGGRLFSFFRPISTYCVERLRSEARGRDSFRVVGFAPVHIRALRSDSSDTSYHQQRLWHSVNDSLVSSGIYTESSLRGGKVGGGEDVVRGGVRAGGSALGHIRNFLLAMQEGKSLPSAKAWVDTGILEEGGGGKVGRFSKTEDLLALYRGDRVEMERALAHFSLRENQVGVVGFLRGGGGWVYFVDLFGDVGVFERLHREVLRSYILSERVYRTGEKGEVAAVGEEFWQRAKEALYGVVHPCIEQREEGDLGDGFRFLRSDFECSGLLYRGKFLYMRASSMPQSYRELRLEEGVTLIGREHPRFVSESCLRYVQLEDPLVSRRHGRFESSLRRCTYRDLGSTNGSEILEGGVFRPVKDVVELEDGDVLRVGGTYLCVRLPGG